MSLCISGMGWVTPLGSALGEVWQRLTAGHTPAPQTVSSTLHSRTYQIYGIPPEITAHAPPHPRLRRASAISRYGVIAGLAALQNAGIQLDENTARRTALIFAVSDGGVVYTKRFYHEVVEAGAHAASPLLFPETVFNASASHLAAILGITGTSYTLVGDGAVGLLAIKMADDLLLNPAIDRCLVVAAEEADWLLCDAYRRWRLLPKGTVLSEGAGAVLLEREKGSVAIEQVETGCHFRRQREAAECLQRVFAALQPAGLVIASANGTFIDRAERAAILHHSPRAKVLTPKAQLGESIGASALWQVICGAISLRENPGATRALISACGMNQQVAGLTLAPRRQQLQS